MIRNLTPKVLAGFLGLLLIQCSLTIDEKALGGESALACADDEKECEVEGVPECVRLTDARFGCATVDCIPCNLPNATAICGNGKCQKSTCHPSWDDCNENSVDGCEAPLNYSVDHCGKCGKECTPRPNTNSVGCGSGHCYVRECLPNFENCNEEYDDGCEVDTRTDPDNCGACSEPCDGVCCQGVCCEGACCDGVCRQGSCDD